MSLYVRTIKYKDTKELSVELEFLSACAKVEGHELMKLVLENTEMQTRFKNCASKLLRAMKRDGVIKLFVFESELESTEKMETIYLINKFPDLASIDSYSDNAIYVKL